MNRKHFWILFIVLFAIAAFTLRSFIKTPDSEEIVYATIEKEVVEIPVEIRETIEKYDSLLTSEINSTGTVGAAIVITFKNEIAFLKCFGVKKAGENDSVNQNTQFRLASVSKTITGTLAGILEDEKVISLDEKIINYIPDFKLKDSVSTNNLSIKNILSHTSGLVPHAYDNMIEEHVPLSKIMQELHLVDIAASPGNLYGYQNVMFSLFDTVASLKTSKSFDQLLHEKVFYPFGMPNATTGFNSFKKSKNKAFPHFGANGNYKTIKLNNRYYSTTPAAGINASITDLAQFLITLLDKKSDAISEHARDIIFEPQIYTPLKRRYLQKWGEVDSRHYAIGWRIIGYKGKKIAYHGGYVEGYRAEIALCRNENIGIAFLTNSPNPVGSISIPAFLDLYFEDTDHTKINQIAF